MDCFLQFADIDGVGDTIAHGDGGQQRRQAGDDGGDGEAFGTRVGDMFGTGNEGGGISEVFDEPFHLPDVFVAASVNRQMYDCGGDVETPVDIHWVPGEGDA